MDFHIITPRGAELVMRVVDGVLEVAPPPAPAGAITAEPPELNTLALEVTT